MVTKLNEVSMQWN